MAIKLKIGNFLDIPVKLSLNDGTPRPANFSFSLTGKRLTTEEARKVDGREYTEILRENITGWKDQTLVLDDETNQPAPFSPEAFEAMLGLVGVPQLLYAAYIHELVKAAAPEATRKN